MVNNKNSLTIFVVDLLIIYLSFLHVYLQHHGFTGIPFNGALLMVFIAVAWFLIVCDSSITKINRDAGLLMVVRDTLIAYSVLSAGVITVVAVFGDFRHNDKLLLWPLLYAALSSTGLRLLFLISVKHFYTSGYGSKTVLVVGGDRVAERVIYQLLGVPQCGYKLYGVLADYYHKTLPREIYLGKLDKLTEIICSGAIDEVIVALPLRREKAIVDTVVKCEQEGIRARVVPDFFRIIQNKATLDYVADIPLIGMRSEPLEQFRMRVLKRAFDMVFSLAFLVLVAPVFLILAMLIKLTSPGPVLFKQKRIGANNVEFEIYKFRSMTVQEKEDSDTIWTTEDDPRVTPIGRFMRKNNLDELPQFWNVLIGNMSVVGPRPEREHFVEQFTEEIRNYRVRHLVKSGITGWAQVNGLRGDTSIKERVEHDIYYLENWSFWLDLKIMWLTLFGKRTQQHAY